MNHRSIVSGLLLGAGAAFLAPGAYAGDHHKAALDACAEAIGEELGIAADTYHQRIDRIRGNSRLLRLRLKVTDQDTGDHFVADCRVRPRKQGVVELAIEGRGARAEARAIAARH